MNKYFIPKEEALALKELGFDERCLAKYQKLAENAQYQLQLLSKERNCNRLDTAISAPLYQQAFRWFREKYNLYQDVGVIFNDDNVISYHEYVITSNNPTFFLGTIKNYTKAIGSDFTTYEEAELACLRELIEIVKLKM